MVRLFLFRLGSLLGLFGLLVWEAFRSQNEDNFAGKRVDNHRFPRSVYFSFGSNNPWFSPEVDLRKKNTYFAENNNFRRHDVYSFRENTWKVCFVLSPGP